jgi:hypothetical protein
LVQMFKGWFKCSCVGGERSRLSERLRGNAQKLYLKWSLTARPIAEFNVLICSHSVLIISDDALVRVVRAYIVNTLFKLVHRFLCSCLYGQQIVQARTPFPLFVLIWSTNCSSSYTASFSYYLTVVPSFQSRASPASLSVLLAM